MAKEERIRSGDLEQLLRNTIDSSMDMIQVFKAVRNEQNEIIDFTWILNNKTSEEIYGDVIGKSLLTLNPGVIQEGIFDTFKDVVETGRHDQSIRHYTHEQFNGWFHQSTVKLGDGVTTTTRNITELTGAKKNIENSHAVLQSIIDNSLNVIQVFESVRDNSGKIIDFKWTIQNLNGFKQNGNVIGKNVLDLNPGVKETGLFDMFVNVVETGVTADHEVFYPHEQFNAWFHQTMVKLNDGFVMNTEDITKRKVSAEEILSLKDEIARQAEDKYRAILNSIDEGFCIYEIIYENEVPVDLRWIEVNPAYEKQTGLKNVAGRFASEVMPGTESNWLSIYNKVAQTGEAIQFEDWHEPTGRWYYTFSSRIGGPGSTQVAVLFSDITDRKLQEKRQKFLLNFSDAIRDAKDEASIVSLVVNMVAKEFRLDRCYISAMDTIKGTAEMVHQFYTNGLEPVPEILRLADFPAVVNEALSRTLVFDDLANDPLLTKRDKRSFEVMHYGALIACPIRIGPHNPVWCFAGVTKLPRHWSAGEIALIEELAERTWFALQKAQIEKALQKSEEKYRTDLEQQVLARTAELERSNFDLKQFAFIISHDLKEPIRKIITFNNMLYSGFEHQMPEQANHYLARINVATNRISTMINDIFEYSKLGFREQMMKPVDLNNIITIIEDDLELSIRKKNAVVIKENLPVVKGSAILLQQLFYNLLSNSIKFSKKDEPLRVKISALITEKNGQPWVVISFEDNGAGFDPKYNESIFHVFNRLHSKDEYEGTGLGLAIVKKIVEQHNGNIFAEGEVGKGARFVVEIPGSV